MGKWEMVKLGNVCLDTENENPTVYDKEIVYIDISSVCSERKGVSGHNIISSLDAPSRARQKVRYGDILVSTVRPNLNAVALVDIQSDDIIASTGFCVLRSDDKRIDNRYLFEFVKSPAFVLSMTRQAKGASYPAVSDKIVKGERIPLPPLLIQQQIADILDRAGVLIEKRKEQIEKLDLLVKSQFIKMFGDPVTNPMGWSDHPLSELGTWGSGGTPPRASAKYFHGDINWYSAGELNDFILKGSIEKISEEAIAETSAKMFPAYSLFVGMYDTAAFKLSITPTAASANQACANVAIYPDKTNVYWLYFNFQIMKPYFLEQRRGIRQQNLNLGMIKSFQTPLPPLALQTQFAAFVERVEAQKAQLKKSLALMELNYKSLMQKCFKGEMC